MKQLAIISIIGACLFAACSNPAEKGAEASLDLATLSSGVYRAYPGAAAVHETEAPAGYEPFYISLYNRHGSRYQPNDKRYANTLRRLQEAHERGALTPYGETLLPQIQLLCDSCLGHGGLLTTVGVRQLAGIGNRMYKHYPTVFLQAQPTSDRHKHIYARASVVPRCGQSMGAFFAGVMSEMTAPFVEKFPGQLPNIRAEVDSANMVYIAYDSPAMRQLSAKDAFWKPAFDRFYEQHTLQESVVKRVFADATGLDSLQFVDDLYWLCVGMQDVDVPGCDLSGAMTSEELFECYRCVNYRMYICNANAPMSRHIPAESASSLLQNIVECADRAIATDTVAADLRFGHDSNLLRLLALMRVKGCTAEVDDPAEAWKVWQEAEICPMGANLQLIFFRPTSTLPRREGDNCNAGEVYILFLHNEKPITLDVAGLTPVDGKYYHWNDVRSFFLKQIKNDNEKTDFIEPVQ